jgi:hypothetical protein
LNKNVYFQTINDEISDIMEQLPQISNMRDFVLVITPKLKFEFHRDYVKAAKELKGLHQSYELLTDREKTEKKKLLEYTVSNRKELRVESKESQRES